MTESLTVQHRKAGIFGAFNRVASRYDLLSGLNPGYHKHLRWSAERLEIQDEGAGSRILDLCCGTGLSTEPLVRLYPRAKITGLDKSEGMLEKAREKESLRSVEFLAGDGMDPGAAGAKGPFEAILMAYGIRNMPDPDACLGEPDPAAVSRRRHLLSRVLGGGLALEPRGLEPGHVPDRHPTGLSHDGLHGHLSLLATKRPRVRRQALLRRTAAPRGLHRRPDPADGWLAARRGPHLSGETVALSRRRMEELTLPRDGKYHRIPSPTSAVVAGGGLAGVAAATVLAERGVSVVLAEQEPFLGGRAAAWTDRLGTGEAFEMERGFHAFFRQYYNLQALLRRIDDQLSFLEPLDDYPILGPGGQIESFSGLPKTPPWNVIALTRRTPTLTLRDLLRVNGRAALAMLQYEADLDLRPLRRPDGRRVPGLALVPAGCAPHALRRLRPLLLQSRGGHVGGRASDDVPLLLLREPGGAHLRRLEATVLQVDLGPPGRIPGRARSRRADRLHCVGDREGRAPAGGASP